MSSPFSAIARSAARLSRLFPVMLLLICGVR